MTNETISEHIIALERAALVEWCRGNPSPYLELYAPELTYFDPFTPRRWDLELKREVYERSRDQLDVKYFEMIEPHVQIHGDVAVLSYNYISSNTTSMWNCTEIYRRFPDHCVGGGDGGCDCDGTGGKWRIIHNHWSDVHSKQ